jgi:hypothetical protein
MLKNKNLFFKKIQILNLRSTIFQKSLFNYNNNNNNNKKIKISFNSKIYFSTNLNTNRISLSLSSSSSSTKNKTKTGLNYYKEMFRQSICEIDRNKFWEEESQEISWFKKPEKILDDTNKPFYKWFSDGEINMTYNCVDRHIENGNGDIIAFIWESAYLNKIKEFSYSQIDKEIKKICKIFIGNNLKKGDRVVIYMPMIPEALFSMLACAKLGLIHCVVFGGFAADELANRLNHCEPKMIVTASAGIEPKSIIPYLPIIKESFMHLKNPGIIIYLYFMFMFILIFIFFSFFF